MNQAENNQLPMDQLDRIRAMSGNNAGLAEQYGYAAAAPQQHEGDPRFIENEAYLEAVKAQEAHDVETAIQASQRESRYRDDDVQRAIELSR